MKNQNSWRDRLTGKVNAYIDDRFQNYKVEIAEDVARGIGALGSIIAVWTVAVLCLVMISIFIAIAIGLIFDSYLLGFGIMGSVCLIVAFIVIRNRKVWIEQRIVQFTREALTGSSDSDNTPVKEAGEFKKQEIHT